MSCGLFFHVFGLPWVMRVLIYPDSNVPSVLYCTVLFSCSTGALDFALHI